MNIHMFGSLFPALAARIRVKGIQSGAVAKLYMRKGFLIYKDMRNYFPIYEEAVSHI